MTNRVKKAIMKDLIIVGAGGFGREALNLAKRINRITHRWNILGFLNDMPDALDGVMCSHRIIGRITDWVPDENQEFVLGISSPTSKEKLARELAGRGFRFTSLISPTALIADYVTLGEGCVVTGNSSIGDNAVIGDFVHIAGSMIGQDTVIGDYSTTTGYVNVASATVGKRVFIGSHAVVLNKVRVGDDAFICAGSIVMRRVPDGARVFGNPAKKVEF